MEILTVQNQFVHMMPSTKVKGELIITFLNFYTFKVTYAFSPNWTLLKKKSLRPSDSTFSFPLCQGRLKDDAIVIPFCTLQLLHLFYFFLSFQESQSVPVQSVTGDPVFFFFRLPGFFLLPFCTLTKGFLSFFFLRWNSLYPETWWIFSEIIMENFD